MSALRSRCPFSSFPGALSSQCRLRAARARVRSILEMLEEQRLNREKFLACWAREENGNVLNVLFRHGEGKRGLRPSRTSAADWSNCGLIAIRVSLRLVRISGRVFAMFCSNSAIIVGTVVRMASLTFIPVRSRSAAAIAAVDGGEGTPSAAAGGVAGAAAGGAAAGGVVSADRAAAPNPATISAAKKMRLAFRTGADMNYSWVTIGMPLGVAEDRDALGRGYDRRARETNEQSVLDDAWNPRQGLA